MIGIPEPGEFIHDPLSGQELSVVPRELFEECRTGVVRCIFWEGSGQSPDDPEDAGIGSLCSQHHCGHVGHSYIWVTREMYATARLTGTSRHGSAT